MKNIWTSLTGNSEGPNVVEKKIRSIVATHF